MGKGVNVLLVVGEDDVGEMGSWLVEEFVVEEVDSGDFQVEGVGAEGG